MKENTILDLYQAQLEKKGSIDGTTHRYLIIARKPLK